MSAHWDMSAWGFSWWTLAAVIAMIAFILVAIGANGKRRKNKKEG
jgi:hypothetical protein